MRLPNSCQGPPVGDEGEGSRQPPSPRLSPRAAPPAAPGSASRATTAGRGGAGGSRGAPAPGRGDAPLGLLKRGAAGWPPSSAPVSPSAPAPAPARAASRGRWRCLSDVLAAAAPLCHLGVVVSGSAASRSLPTPSASRTWPRAKVRAARGRRNPPGEIRLASGPPWDAVGWTPGRGKERAQRSSDPAGAAAQGGVDGD